MYAKIPDVFPELRGGGVFLRAMDETDLPAWYARLTDPEAAAMAGDPVATSMQATVDGLVHHRRAFAQKDAIRWAIVPEKLGTSVGSFGLGSLDEHNLSASLGAAVGRAHWSHGYATAAARLVIDYAIDVLGIERIHAEVLTTNVASARVLEKLAFRREGLMRGYQVYNGERRDHYLYALLSRDIR